MTELENMLAEARLLITALHSAGIIEGDGNTRLGTNMLVGWFFYEDEPSPYMIQFLTNMDPITHVPASHLTMTYKMDGKVVRDLETMDVPKGGYLQWLMWLTAYNRSIGFTPETLAMMESA